MGKRKSLDAHIWAAKLGIKLYQEEPMKVYNWMTNDPKIAKAFKKIDLVYERDVSAARDQPLADKIETIRKARLKRDAAMRKWIKGHTFV